MINLSQDPKIAVLGLGYIGVPLAMAFGRQSPAGGFDINAQRIAELNAGEDRTLEVSAEELATSKQLTLSGDLASLADCNVFIVTVPVLERVSGLTFNVDFFAGYSPERANPGDKHHRLATIMKVTAGSTREIADFVDGRKHGFDPVVSDLRL